MQGIFFLNVMGKIVLVLVSILVCQITYANAISKCKDTGSNYTKGSTFETNLNLVLTDLTSKSSAFKFNTSKAGEETDQVYGLFQCRDDVGLEDCNKCLKNATRDIVEECPLYKEAVKWYSETDHCMVRYADHNIFSKLETEPHFFYEGDFNVSDYTKFAPIFNSTMTELIQNASLVTPHFRSAKANWTLLEQFYSYAQCTPDIDIPDCYSCLSAALAKMIDCCSTLKGSRVLMPSCVLRFEKDSFLNDTSSPAPPLTPPAPGSPESPTSSGLSSNKMTIIATVASCASVGLLVLVVVLWICVCRKRPKEASSNVPPASELNRESDVRSLEEKDVVRYDFATLKAATGNFSSQNKLGEGGFGNVYKGTLVDGECLAIKRLSDSSRQGTKEFMAEARFLARLQHRNLVKLVGFCSKREEKLLVYEFLSNSSLDGFIFDPEKRQLLNWVARNKTIVGIARGLQYLHEDSRFTTIHRDLKPENILLDDDMNPKIADFGLARLFERSQKFGKTINIAGTRGYMAPECLSGEYSSKSDVYSFGVMLLEIVCGHRMFNRVSQEDFSINAWRLWNEERAIELVDPKLDKSYSSKDIERCIQIGLLCLQPNEDQRPTMTDVVLMLTVGAIDLPLPSPPKMTLPQFNLRTIQTGEQQSDSEQFSTKSITDDLCSKPR